MLASLTFARRRPSTRRAVAIGLGAVLLLAAFALHQPDPPPDARVVPLAQALAPSTWALAIPTGWLATPAQGARPGDRIDLIAIRPGDRAAGYPVAYDLRVMTADDRSLVVELDEPSAMAIAIARSSGMLIVPLLQSAR